MKISDWITAFESFYFETRVRNSTTELTWKNEYLAVFKKLPGEEELTAELLKRVVLLTRPDTRSRRRYAVSAKALAEFAELPTKDFSRLKGKYSPLKATPRNLPTDQTITEVWQQLKPPDWKWAFGMLAAYGLRPHEIFHLNLEAFPTIFVQDGKTGFRHVRPIYPEWAEVWGLQNQQLPECSGKTNKDLGSRVSHAFRRLEIPFCAYDLRHRWAVRSLEFGYSGSLAAKEMGHSLQVHDAIYHRWIGMQEHDKAYSYLASRSDRPRAPEHL